MDECIWEDYRFMSNYVGKKESRNQENYANLIKSVYETSIISDNKTVSELVDEIKNELLKVMK